VDYPGVTSTAVHSCGRYAIPDSWKPHVATRISKVIPMQKTARSYLRTAVCAMIAGTALVSPQRIQAQLTSRTLNGVSELRLSSFETEAFGTLTVSDVFATSAPTESLELFRVNAARLLPDGGIAIANSGAHEVIVLDARGRLRTRFGRKGEGPGEFNTLATLDVGYADDLVTYDARQGRLTFFDMNGAVVRTQRLSANSPIVDLKPLTFTRDGSILAVHGQSRAFASRGSSRAPVPLLMFDSTGGAVRTLTAFPGTEFIYIPVDQGVYRTAIAFGAKAVASGRNGRVAIGSTDSLAIDIYDDGRLTHRIRAELGAVPVRPEHLAHWRSGRMGELAGASPESRRAAMEIPHRRSFPMFDDVLVDDRGRVWIASYAPPGDEQRTWLVVDLDAVTARRVVLPAAVTLMDVRGDRLALLERNEWDEQSIRVMSIR
jgi:hypothetical protein